MSRNALVLAVVVSLAAAGCNKKKADPDQGFHPPEAAGGGPTIGGGANPHGDLPPPPAVGPGALGGAGGGAMGGGGSMGTATGPMPNDDVHSGLAAGGGANPHGGGGGGVDVSQMGIAPPDPNRPVDKNKFVRGTIHPADATKDKIPAGALIYISVKKTDPATGDATPGMPIATLKLTAQSWPLSFEITEANLMTAQGDLSGDVVVTARYAQNSDPLMKQSGDVTGKVRTTVPGDKLDITLDTVLP